MCKSKQSTDAAEPTSIRRSAKSYRSSRTIKSSENSRIPSKSISDPSTSNAYFTTDSSYRDSSGTSSSSKTSLATFRESLPENPHIYDFAEIFSATKNFLGKRYNSSSSPSWRCSIRGKDVIVFQRKLRRSIETSRLRERLSLICRSHHASIIKLLGASISGHHIYLVYDFVKGANLTDCLRNPKNPKYTVLSTWISRIQVASDIAQGLDYIHNSTGLNLNLVHNHIQSSSIIITESSLNAKICHFGTAELCGEINAKDNQNSKNKSEIIEEISEELSSPSSISSKLKRSDSRSMKFEGTKGYMSPEFQSMGIATQKSDVFAFGVVILELFSGEEPLKYRFDEENGEIKRICLMETAREGLESGRIREWVDRRLKDSFPVEVAEKITRIALDCVHMDPDKRPDMSLVAGKISKLYLESRIWTDKMSIPTDFSISMAPR